MTEDPNNKSPLSFGDLLKAIGGWVTFGAGLVGAAIGLIKVVKGEAAIASWIFLIAGLGIVYAFLLYVRLVKRGSSLVFLNSSGKSSRFAYQEKTRRYALVGVIALTLVLALGTIGYFYYDSLRPKQIIILVADFDGPDPQKYRVTETLIRQLRASIEDFSDVQIKTLNGAINERDGSEAARRAGRDRKATIVLWGWYGKTAEKVLISANFEVLQTPKLLSLGAKGSMSLLPVEDIESFRLQTVLSSEMSYLTLLTIGLARLESEDYDGAIVRLSRAISQAPTPDQFIDPSVAYFFRARALLLRSSRDWKSAVNDLDEAITLRSDFQEAYAERAFARLSHGQSNYALADCREALKYQPEYPFANVISGLAFELQLNTQAASAAYNEAIRSKPKDDKDKIIRAFAFLRMGNLVQAVSELTEIDKSDEQNMRTSLLINSLALFQAKAFAPSLKAVNDAIKLKPQLQDGYTVRAMVFLGASAFDRAIDDCNHVLAIDPSNDSALLYRGQA